jgi:hypothetical protein
MLVKLFLRIKEKPPAGVNHHGPENLNESIRLVIPGLYPVKNLMNLSL